MAKETTKDILKAKGSIGFFMDEKNRNIEDFNDGKDYLLNQGSNAFYFNHHEFLAMPYLFIKIKNDKNEWLEDRFYYNQLFSDFFTACMQDLKSELEKGTSIEDIVLDFDEIVKTVKKNKKDLFKTVELILKNKSYLKEQ